MTKTEHKAFAMRLGVPEAFYDDLNARHSARNARIREARDRWLDAIGTDQEKMAAAELHAAIRSAL